jgi:large subunit ribosomal protein L15
MRDIIKKIPKLRGYRFKSASTKYSPVNVGALNIFEKGASVTPETLFARNLIRRSGGKMPEVKILASGDLTVSLAISNCVVSEAARAKIEKAGGSVAVK